MSTSTVVNSDLSSFFDLLHPETVAAIADDLAGVRDRYRSLNAEALDRTIVKAASAVGWLRGRCGLDCLRLERFPAAGVRLLEVFNSGEAASAVHAYGEDPIALLAITEWLIDLFWFTSIDSVVTPLISDLGEAAELAYNAGRAGWDRNIPAGLYVGAYAVAAGISDPAHGVGVEAYAPASLARAAAAVDSALNQAAMMDRNRDRYYVATLNGDRSDFSQATVDGEKTGGSFFSYVPAGRLSVGFDGEDRAWYVRLDTQDRGSFTWGRLDLYGLVQVLIGIQLA